MGTRKNRFAEAVFNKYSRLGFGKISIPMYTPVFQWLLRGYTFHGHVLIMYSHAFSRLSRDCLTTFVHVSQKCRKFAQISRRQDRDTCMNVEPTNSNRQSYDSRATLLPWVREYFFFFFFGGGGGGRIA